MSDEPSGIAHFKIEGKLGAGGMGVVYAAADEKLRRKVALKLLPEEFSRSEERRTRFLREARSAAAVTHANIATIYEVGEEGGRIYISMELVEGETLRKRIAREALTPSDAVGIAKQIAKGLGKAHDKGIVHRDLKPDNVMVTPDGDVKILDFGLAKLREVPQGDERSASVLESAETASHVTQEGHVLGTPGYMSPEQAMGKAVDARSDLFSLGVMLYELLTGAQPFGPGSTMEVIVATTRDEPKPLAEVAPQTPEALRAVVERCLRKKPEERYASARALLDDLEAVTSERPASSPSTRDVPRAPAPAESAPASATSKRAWRGVAIVVALFFALGGTSWLRKLREPSEPPKPAPSASGGPRAGPTGLGDLPAPASTSPEAVAEYSAGMRSLREGGWVAARASFERALKADPTLAIAHLRLALVCTFAGVTADSAQCAREAYAKALTHRDRASERDRGLIDALEPILQRSEWDRRECAKRLRALSEKFPDDAELYVLRGWMLAAHPEEALEAGRRATAIDDRYADAWQLHGNALQWLGRSDEALVAYQRCVDVSPRASDCLSWIHGVYTASGDCERALDATKKCVDRDPACAFLLPMSLYGVGRPRDSIRAVFEQQWSAMPEPPRAAIRTRDETLLALAYGDFGSALGLADKSLALSAPSPDLLQHQLAIQPLIYAALEAGEDARAAELASRYVAGLDVWRRGGMITPLRDYLTPSFARVALEGGKLTRADYEARRKAWLSAATADDTPAAASWAYAWAAPAETAAEAREALASAPAKVELDRVGLSFVFADAFVGKTYLLAGRVDDALPHLRRASSRCDAMWDLRSHTRALFDLGQALEAKADAAGACAAYGRILDRWAAAKPRSVTAEKARARMKALACAK